MEQTSGPGVLWTDGSRFMPAPAAPGMPRAIDEAFPFEQISEIAEAESWRKEVFRPIYHLHKWWAQRLGSVFRAALLAAALPAEERESVLEWYGRRVSWPDLVVFDPFMGSGTIVGEAYKLGCKVIGRDINPVAYRAVCTALGPLERRDLLEQYQRLEATAGKRIRQLYQSQDSRGYPCEVLYYFWVKTLNCLHCGRSVELFPHYVFARHADRTREVRVQVLCPECGEVFPMERDQAETQCPACRRRFNPHQGPAKRTTAVCTSCGREFSLVAAARAQGKPPGHHLYAKLVLRTDGSKEYLRSTPEDMLLYEQASRWLREWKPPLPQVEIRTGNNTRQILNYGYRYWHQLFNERQLLALAILAEAICDLPAGPARDALALLFSGTLEFNNLFASYKGEGTGAVRHMFSHHILKPERLPIEANVWGTPYSSGSFSTLFRRRLLRALAYRERPFEIVVTIEKGRRRVLKLFELSPPLKGTILSKYPVSEWPAGALYLSCGTSSHTDIPERTVDLILTDPPFFDNVHYSELADFFYVWHTLYFWPTTQEATTRRPEEVQDVDALAFAQKLQAVFAECHRVLKDGGRLVFSYQHSREEGWLAIARAVSQAGFTFLQSHPVRSEMAVAAPKSQAREPITLDILLVCIKSSEDRRARLDGELAIRYAAQEAQVKVAALNRRGWRLSRKDVWGVLFSQFLVKLSAGRQPAQICQEGQTSLPQLNVQAEQIWQTQQLLLTATKKHLPRQQGELPSLF